MTVTITAEIATALYDLAIDARRGNGAADFYRNSVEKDAYYTGILHAIATLTGNAKDTEGIEAALDRLDALEPEPEPEPTPEPERPSVKVGDVFYSSWGYDQTNADFYQVVGLTPSGKSAKLRMIAATKGPDSTRLYPVPGSFRGWGDKPSETITRRLKTGYKGEPSVNISDNRFAWWYDLDENPGCYDTQAAGLAGH